MSKEWDALERYVLKQIEQEGADKEAIAAVRAGITILRQLSEDIHTIALNGMPGAHK